MVLVQGVGAPLNKQTSGLGSKSGKHLQNAAVLSFGIPNRLIPPGHISRMNV